MSPAAAYSPLFFCFISSSDEKRRKCLSLEREKVRESKQEELFFFLWAAGLSLFFFWSLRSSALLDFRFCDFFLFRKRQNTHRTQHTHGENETEPREREKKDRHANVF